jgi:hypothetical protein
VGKAATVRTTVVKTHGRQRELNPTPVEPPSVRHLPLEHACYIYIYIYIFIYIYIYIYICV